MPVAFPPPASFRQIGSASACYLSNDTRVLSRPSDYRRNQRDTREVRGEIVLHELPHGASRFRRPGGMVRLKNGIVERLEPTIDIRLVPETRRGRLP
jgi:hypothetical protein